MAPPTTIFPTQEREAYIVKEAVPGTVPASNTWLPFPVTSIKPSDKPMMLYDESFQGSMGDSYGAYQGPEIASIDIGGNFYGDTFGHLPLNLLGDYTVSGTAASPAAVTNAPIAVGATTLAVASGGASFTTGMFVWIEDAGTPAANEVVMVTSTGSATSIPITATRFAHLTATPFTNTTAPYTHVFALLNGLTGAANGAAQGPSHTIIDRTGIPATGLAAQYSYVCLSELAITANAEKLLTWSAKATCQIRTIPGSAIGTVNVSSVQTYPAWRSVMGIGGPASGGTAVKDVAEYALTLSRAIKAYNSLQGSQAPYVIGRGKQSNAGKLTISPAIDESALLALLANTQPQHQLVSTNGLSGASLVSLQSDILLPAYETADIADGSELFGYDVAFKPQHTAASSGGITMTGASGGKGAVKLTLINALPSY
jgi:hypothetical protein